MFKFGSARLRNLLIELGLAAAATLVALMLSLPTHTAASDAPAAMPDASQELRSPPG